MSYSRNAVVKQAQSWIGCKESDGSHKKIIDVYNSHKPLARGYKVKYTDSWCAAFVSAVSIKCGYTAIIPTECSCPQMIELFKDLGEWVENDAYKPSAGDIILYDWNDSGSGDNTGTPDHIGIVEKVSGNTITIIEGNKGDAVARRTIQVNGVTIRGYGVPKYDGSSTGSSSSSSASSASSGTYSGGKSANYKVKINTPSGVNVRKGPDEDKYAKFDAIENGKTVTITKVSGNWGYAKEYGGWICLDYTKKVTSGSSSSGSSRFNKSDWVRRLQKECNAQGFSDQKVDGKEGPNTLAGCPLVKEGASGGITKLIQEYLIAHGYSCGSAGADGKFGSGTAAAVRAYQKDHGLSVDGDVGPKTWASFLGL